MSPRPDQGRPETGGTDPSGSNGPGATGDPSGHDPAGGSDDPGTAGGASGPAQPGAPGSPPSNQDPAGGEEHADEPNPGSGGTNPAGGPARTSGAPAHPAKRNEPPPRPRPPRRTGVFLDHEDLREHVGGLLRTILGSHEVDAFGNFTFTHDEARIFVTVGPSPVGPQVGVFSVTNVDLDLSTELARFLLTTNHTMGFGAFSYDPDNRAVWLRHTLLGTTLDLPELQASVAAVATTAASVDDAIRNRFGGRTFQEAPTDVQQGVEPPNTGPDGPASAGGYL